MVDVAPVTHGGLTVDGRRARSTLEYTSDSLSAPDPDRTPGPHDPLSCLNPRGARTPVARVLYGKEQKVLPPKRRGDSRPWMKYGTGLVDGEGVLAGDEFPQVREDRRDVRRGVSSP